MCVAACCAICRGTTSALHKQLFWLSGIYHQLPAWLDAVSVASANQQELYCKHSCLGCLLEAACTACCIMCSACYARTRHCIHSYVQPYTFLSAVLRFSLSRDVAGHLLRNACKPTLMALSSLAIWCSCWFGHCLHTIQSVCWVPLTALTRHLCLLLHVPQLLVIQLFAAVLSREVSRIFSVLLDP